MREDKKRIPVGFIPNGSGNDLCHNLGILTVDKALDYIVKGDLIKMDISKVLLDHEKEEEIKQEVKFDQMRYSLINSSFGMVGEIVYGAERWKGCCCNAYTMASIIEILKSKTHIFDIIVDGKTYYENIRLSLLMGS